MVDLCSSTTFNRFAHVLDVVGTVQFLQLKNLEALLRTARQTESARALTLNASQRAVDQLEVRNNQWKKQGGIQVSELILRYLFYRTRLRQKTNLSISSSSCWRLVAVMEEFSNSALVANYILHNQFFFTGNSSAARRHDGFSRATRHGHGASSGPSRGAAPSTPPQRPTRTSRRPSRRRDPHLVPTRCEWAGRRAVHGILQRIDVFVLCP